MLSVASCSQTGIRKRRNEGEYNNAESSGVKVPRGEFYFVLESESDVSSSEEDTESISSIHNKSTDFAKDTSDTSSKTSRSDGESLTGLEYEVVSLSEHEHPFDSYSSGTDSGAWGRRLGQSETEEGEGGGQSMWADGSSAASDIDAADAPASRPRTCLKCKAQTNLLQYCQQCYKVRKDFFPPRPKRCKKRPSFKKKPSVKGQTKSEEKRDPWMESSGSLEQMTPSSSEGLCNVCFKNPKNGAFLHCRWVHIYSCYQCSLKIWFSTKCCPLCNSKIRQVLKVAMA